MRAIDGVSVTSYPNYIVRQLDLIRANNGVVVHDPILGWRLKDNIGGKGFTTGRYGLRMNSDEIREPPQSAILAVGDFSPPDRAWTTARAGRRSSKRSQRCR